VAREGGGVRIDGLVAPPAQCRKSAKWEYVFVNGRYVRDRFISHAIREGYRSLLKSDEHPVVFLFLTIDPEQVDVNVHPTKIEVRWRDSNYIHAQVLAALREKFLSTNLDRALQPAPRDDEEYRQRVRSAMVDFFTRAPSGQAAQPEQGRRGGGSGWAERAGATQTGGELGVATRESEGARTEVRSTVQTPPLGFQAAPEIAVAEARPGGLADEGALPGLAEVAAGGHPSVAAGQAAPTALPRRAAVRGVAALQIHNTYLVVETDDGLMIIDQHALHERILYEELRRRLTEKPLESQRLLMPEVVRVAPDRLEVLETHADTLQRLGIVLAPSGPRSVALHAFPLLLERADPATFVRDLLDLLSEVGQRPHAESLVHAVLDMMACKAAVKAGQSLTPEEIAALLARRELAERASHCPHGRPTTLRLTLRDLERQFKRT
jgi:DNA mismatch repair protein MutL